MTDRLRQLYHRYDWCEYFQLKIEFSGGDRCFKLGFGLRAGGACPRRQWAWLRRQQASSNFRFTANLLKRPFASAVNATSERSNVNINESINIY